MACLSSSSTSLHQRQWCGPLGRVLANAYIVFLGVARICCHIEELILPNGIPCNGCGGHATLFVVASIHLDGILLRVCLLPILVVHPISSSTHLLFIIVSTTWHEGLEPKIPSTSLLLFHRLDWNVWNVSIFCMSSYKPIKILEWTLPSHCVQHYKPWLGHSPIPC